jgi:hypothetical protein
MKSFQELLTPQLSKQEDYPLSPVCDRLFAILAAIP